ncbi:MAG: rhomboid family intramembrane serine protease [Burkholderiales bacterium]|nr:rhomboid family intramembrane serine protease [Burkholderiales bacterium]
MTNDISQENSVFDPTELKKERDSLPSEIETIVEYNIRWSEIRDSASTEDAKNEAIKAIETNEKLLVGNRNLLKAIEKYLALITFNAKIWRRRFVSSPFAGKIYEVSTVELLDSAILLNLSKNKITKSDGAAFTVVTGTVTKLDVSNLSLKFNVKGLGQFTVEFIETVPFLILKKRLEEYLSTEAKREQLDEKAFLERLQLADQNTWATWLLIALNASVFFLMLLQGYGVFSPDTVIAVTWGANFGALTLGGEWWRLVTPMFLHFGVTHLSVNMLGLYQNAFLERLFGRTNFLLIYFISGIAGSLASLWYNPWKISAGASGAIFGLCGAITALALIPGLHLSIKFKKMLLRGGVFFIAINTALAYAIPMIDKAAHVGGYFAGLALGALFSRSIYKEASKKSDLRTFMHAIAGLGGALAIGYFGIYKNEKMQGERPVKLADYYFYEAKVAEEKKDFTSALKYSKLSSDSGSKDAPNLVGYLISYGLGVEANRGLSVEANRQAAIEWFKLGAERGDPWATKNLADIYWSKKPKEVSDLDVLKLYIDAANLGKLDVFNKIQLKIMVYKYSSERVHDLAATASYVDTLASEQRPAMLGLKGWMTYSGYGYASNKVEGERLMRKAFELGDSTSAVVLGVMYQMGTDRAIDLSKAFEFFSVGAKSGNPRAMLFLGISYRDGLGVVQDVEQSKSWLKKAASLGEKSAETELAK